MDEAMVDEVAVKRDPVVDVHWGVHWGVHLAAANRGVGMGRRRAAADRRAGAKCAPAAMPAASTTAARGESIGGNREDDNCAQCQDRVTLKERFGRHVWFSSRALFLCELMCVT